MPAAPLPGFEDGVFPRCPGLPRHWQPRCPLATVLSGAPPDSGSPAAGLHQRLRRLLQSRAHGGALAVSCSSPRPPDHDFVTSPPWPKGEGG
eukprot:511431-Alexandrium_andersonii.AAC.1